MKKDVIFKILSGTGAAANIASEFMPFASHYRVALKAVSFICNLSSAAILSKATGVVAQQDMKNYIINRPKMARDHGYFNQHRITQAGAFFAFATADLFELGTAMVQQDVLLKGSQRGLDGLMACGQGLSVLIGISEEKNQQQKINELKP
jgi:hypothetical protein